MSSVPDPEAQVGAASQALLRHHGSPAVVVRSTLGGDQNLSEPKGTGSRPSSFDDMQESRPRT
jgi:hypothetical protein